MSYKATAWAYELPLRNPAKPVLVALADFADEAGSCYPGQDKIAGMTGLSVRTVRRALEYLEALGVLTRTARYDARGHRTSDRYVLNVGVQFLPATVTGGQSDLRSVSPRLPVSESTPTGHSDRGTTSRTTSDPSGGREAPAPTPDTISDLDQEPWNCRRHPHGTDRPCTSCRHARIRWEQDTAAAAHAGFEPIRKPSPAWRPGLCIPHLQRLGECAMCEREGVA